MKKVTSKIMGKKTVVVDGSGSSYDVAYQLCRTLRLYLKKFLCDADLGGSDIIIYPSAWYENFFEITFRDKNHVEGNQCVDADELMGVVEKFVPHGWVCYGEDYYLVGYSCKTPIVLKFRFEGVD